MAARATRVPPNQEETPDQVRSRLFAGSVLMGWTVSWRPMPPRRTAGLHDRTISIIQSCAAEPPLRHPGPCGFVFRAARELGHEFAFGGKSQERL